MPYEYPWEKTTTIKILNMTVTLRSFLVCVSFLLPSSQPQATADIFPITLDWFRFSRILCKWNHAVHAFDFSVWRLSHIIIILTLIRVVQCPMMSSSTLLSGIPLHGYMSLSVYLACFQFLLLQIYKCARNIHYKLFFIEV